MAQEKQFEDKIKKYLASVGAWYVKYWGGGQFTQAGIPDLLCCINGQFFGIEVKADNGRPSVLQLRTLSKIKEAGGVAVLIYPKYWESFKQQLNKFIRTNDKSVFCGEYIINSNN